jgi:hypothetical protein
MEMESLPIKPKPRETDPFIDVIEEHLLQELVLQHLNCNEVKSLLSVSREWNKIASASESCMRNFKMNVDCYDSDKLSAIIMNGRKYRQLLLSNVYTALPQKIVQSIGTDLRVLTVRGFVIERVTDLLKSCGNIEQLKLEQEERWFKAPDNVNSGDHIKLPNLKSLELSCPSQQLLHIFDDVSTLKSLSLRANGVNYCTELFEKLILRQEGLKSLTLLGKKPTTHNTRRMFGKTCVKFQLETLIVDHFFVEKSSAAKFFKKQQNLKHVELRGFCDQNVFAGIYRIDYKTILSTIFSIQNLETLKIDVATADASDFDSLGNIHNESVKNLTYYIFDDSSVGGKVFDVFPSLEKVCIIPFLTKQLKLQGIPSGKLDRISCGLIKTFIYEVQPPAPVFYDTEFEKKLTNFIEKHKSVTHLSIGHPSWVSHGFGLGISFWNKILRALTDLENLVIYNPRKIKELIEEIKKKKCEKLKQVTFITNNAGKEVSTKITKEKLPWLNVKVFP